MSRRGRVDVRPPGDRDAHIPSALVAVCVLVPTLGATLGIDGGPIFQLLATEDLDISPTALGLAFGAGIVSVPIQLVAARTPLRRARPNLQRFLVIGAVQAWVLALLLALGVSGRATAVALVVTVTAEIALSVLYATAWQPLLSHTLTATARQRLNTRVQALARVLGAVAVLAFAAMATWGRAASIVAVGLAAVCAAVALRRVVVPEPALQQASGTADAGGDGASPRSWPTAAFVVIALANVAAMPLWLVYLDRVLWPDGDLGLVAAAQIVTAVTVLLLWRPTGGDLRRRTTVAAVLVLAATASPLLLQAPVTGAPGAATLLLATAVAAAGTTLIRIATLEQIHRTVRSIDSVRTFTVLDVVASTSLQAGLLVAGPVIAASEAWTSHVDPYKAFTTVAAAATLVATVHAGRSSSGHATGT